MSKARHSNEAKKAGKNSVKKTEISRENDTFLHQLIQNKSWSDDVILEFGKRVIIDGALNNGDEHGNTPFMIAIHENKKQLVEFMITYEEWDISQQLAIALYLAMIKGDAYIDIVTTLIEHTDHDVAADKYGGRTGFLYAVSLNKTNIVKIMLSKKGWVGDINVQFECEGSKTVLQVALSDGNAETAAVLIQYGAQNINTSSDSALILAIMNGYTAIVNDMFSTESFTKSIDHEQITNALQIAKTQDNKNIIDLLENHTQNYEIDEGIDYYDCISAEEHLFDNI